MPPQQAYGLLDFIDDRFHLGAHRIPLSDYAKRPGLVFEQPGRELEPDLSRAGNMCKPRKSQRITILSAGVIRALSRGRLCLE